MPMPKLLSIQDVVAKLDSAIYESNKSRPSLPQNTKQLVNSIENRQVLEEYIHNYIPANTIRGRIRNPATNTDIPAEPLHEFGYSVDQIREYVNT